jgi:iron(III) transport system substrate-binding protein
LLLSVLAAAGCSQPAPEVVVYCALDREFSQPILDRFERETGVRVRAKFDTESTKSVGLAAQLLHERNRPRCDVFWNNEILHTVRLAHAGVFQAYASPIGREYGVGHRSSEDFWYGFAARVRILLVNTAQVSADQVPQRLEDLTLPQWRGRVGMAKPLFGTTATHVACLFSVDGREATKALLRRLKENDVRILSGNKQVAVEVGAGALAMGLTDTDDALAELRAGRPVRMVYLDHRPGQRGLLMIPNTVAIVAGCRNQDSAKRLVDFLLAPATEQLLAQGDSGQIPLHPGATVAAKLGMPPSYHIMSVDFARAAREWDEVAKFINDEFTAP